MAPTGLGRRGRMAAAVMLLVLLASLIPLASVYATSVTLATGGSAIPADDFGTSNFTTLSGPAILATAATDLNGTTILNVPAGFKFNAGAGNTSISGAGCTLTGSLVVTTTQATFTGASNIAGCILTIVGLQVQPTAGPGLVTGDITKTGTSTAPGGVTNYGTLTKVAGAVTELIYAVQPSANNAGGLPWGTQPAIIARDQFGNAVTGAPVGLSITPGTGATGATLACNTNPILTVGGVANFAAPNQQCKIDLAGTYKIRATSGAVTVDSGTIAVNVGPPSKIIFKSYPATSTPPLFTPQPIVAVTDAGGNTVTTFPSSAITLALNKNSGTFTCTGGLSTMTVSGVATFAGCTQTAPDTGYTLTATINAFNITGPAFAVTPASLAFVAGPGSPVAGQPFPTNVQVAIQNGGSTITSGVSATVTLAIGTNPSAGALTCTGGTAVGTISGVATFTGCSIDKTGTGYTLVATASNVVPAQTLASATSAAFNVSNNIPPASITLTTFCGTPTPESTTGTNQCPLDNSKSPPQANIKLPQATNEGVRLQAHIATNGASRSITFEVSKDQTTWSTIGTVTTNGSGNASVFYRPSDNRYYRVTFAGASDLGAATSSTVRVVVRALIFIRPTGCTSSAPCHVNLNATVVFTATARPNRPELPNQFVQYTVQRKSGSTWVNVTTDVVPVSKSTGTAQFSVTFSVKSTWRLRANLQPTPVNANSFPTEFEYYSVS